MNIIKSLINQTQTSEHKFKNSVQHKARFLLALAQVTVDKALHLERLDRPLLNQLYIFSVEVEEFLDYADALLNNYWYAFRRNIAVIKIISEMCTKVLHIRDSYERYQLLTVEGNFKEETLAIIKLLREHLISACSALLSEAEKREIKFSSENTPDSINDKVEFNFRLPTNKRVRHEEKPGLTVVALATEFLNLSEPNELFECSYFKNNKKLITDYIPHPINTEIIRALETHFHSMQSKYDTFVLGSDLVQQDKNLSVMRGHISVIYYLLKIACESVHYYQRHLAGNQVKVLFFKSMNSGDDKVVATVLSYALLYADCYRKVSRDLCRTMLKQYAKMGKIDVSVPNYRGFHVRPSTLVSKIVNHYGSDVKMILHGSEYNAAMPLDLFRANEELNAYKRKNMIELMTKTQIFKAAKNSEATFEELKRFARDVFLELAEKKQIIIYDPFFTFSDIEEEPNEDRLTFIKRSIARYMALGKFDASIDEVITFTGDQRVLEDLKILADNGYGEDRYGNNRVLPHRLSYLQQELCSIK